VLQTYGSLETCQARGYTGDCMPPSRSSRQSRSRRRTRSSRLTRSTSRPALAAEVWRRLFDFIVRTSSQRNAALARYGLTPNDSRALFTIDAKGRTMQSLARAWACDPSNATFIVNRLEERRLAERRSLDGDRRVKLVALTARGLKTRAALTKDLYDPPPELLTLDRKDLLSLLAAAEKLTALDSDEG
jgi:DNA-binding MarR family transcriptional regulator